MHKFRKCGVSCTGEFRPEQDPDWTTTPSRFIANFSTGDCGFVLLWNRRIYFMDASSSRSLRSVSWVDENHDKWQCHSQDSQTGQGRRESREWPLIREDDMEMREYLSLNWSICSIRYVRYNEGWSRSNIDCHFHRYVLYDDSVFLLACRHYHIYSPSCPGLWPPVLQNQVKSGQLMCFSSALYCQGGQPRQGPQEWHLIGKTNIPKPASLLCFCQISMQKYGRRSCVPWHNTASAIVFWIVNISGVDAWLKNGCGIPRGTLFVKFISLFATCHDQKDISNWR